MKQVKAKIISNRTIGPQCYHMALSAPSVAKEIKPGQFVHVRCSDGLEPLLRRPFSLHKKTNKTIEIMYKVVGKGTEALSTKATGDFVDILGPLGNGFDTKPSAILVAGGMGVAPLVALAKEIAHEEGLHVLIGACAKSHILCEEEFEELGAEILVSTEDGSKGVK